MKVKGIVWVGVETDHYDQMVRFARETLGLRAIFEGEFANAETIEFEFDNETRFQVTRGKQSAPSPLFEVDDLTQARNEIQSVGIEIPGADQSDGSWSWFSIRAPDGNNYSFGARIDS